MVIRDESCSTLMDPISIFVKSNACHPWPVAQWIIWWVFWQIGHRFSPLYYFLSTFQYHWNKTYNPIGCCTFLILINHSIHLEIFFRPNPCFTARKIYLSVLYLLWQSSHSFRVSVNSFLVIFQVSKYFIYRIYYIRQNIYQVLLNVWYKLC